MSAKHETHFPNLASPVEQYVAAGGRTVYTFRSQCGFDDRQVSNDLRKVTCLLCLRSLISIVRSTARERGSRVPVLTEPHLFSEIRKVTNESR